MNTFAWVLILGGLLIFRTVYKGRIMNIGEDLSDSFLAFASGDFKGFTEVLGRTGDGNVVSATHPTQLIKGVTPTNTGHEDGSANLNSTVIALGTAAKGYRLGATGPDWYDCSGLVYRAVQKFGYKGPRFTTDNVMNQKGFTKISEASASTGDIVLWPTHHMGVINNKTDFWSARNPRSGIGMAKIKGFRKEDPVYVRYYPPTATPPSSGGGM